GDFTLIHGFRERFSGAASAEVVAVVSWSGTAAKWALRVNGTITFTSTTSVAAGTQWQVLETVIDPAAATCTFLVDGVSVFSRSLTVPTGVTSPCYRVDNVSAGSQTF